MVAKIIACGAPQAASANRVSVFLKQTFVFLERSA
jgi:hypothetical protein